MGYFLLEIIWTRSCWRRFYYFVFYYLFLFFLVCWLFLWDIWTQRRRLNLVYFRFHRWRNILHYGWLDSFKRALVAAIRSQKLTSRNFFIRWWQLVLLYFAAKHILYSTSRHHFLLFLQFFPQLLYLSVSHFLHIYMKLTN